MIVLLGILGVTAAGKFTDLSSDAEEAALRYTGGAILSVSNLVYMSSLVKGVQDEAATNLDTNGDGIDDIAIVYGYPSGDRNGIPNAMNGAFSNDWAYAQTFGGSQFWATRASKVGFSGYTNNNIPISSTGCYVRYRPASGPGQAPTIDYIISGC